MNVKKYVEMVLFLINNVMMETSKMEMVVLLNAKSKIIFAVLKPKVIEQIVYITEMLNLSWFYMKQISYRMKILDILFLYLLLKQMQSKRAI